MMKAVGRGWVGTTNFQISAPFLLGSQLEYISQSPLQVGGHVTGWVSYLPLLGAAL